VIADIGQEKEIVAPQTGDTNDPRRVYRTMGPWFSGYH